MTGANPFTPENNPFTPGQGAQPGQPGAGQFPPPAQAETTKPRQMPGGGGGDTNVPQPGGEETAPPESSVPAKAAYIRAINPHLPESVVQRLARRVVAEYDNNPLSHGMTTYEKRDVSVGQKPKSNVGDLNDPYNNWSPLNYDHPDYAEHAGKKPWELGDFNDPSNPHSPLNRNHPLNQHYTQSGIQFGQQSRVTQPRTSSLVEFYKQAEYANDPLGFSPTPTAEPVGQPTTPATNKEHGLPTHIPGGAGLLNKVLPAGEGAAAAEGAGAAAAGAARLAPLLLL